MGKAILHVVRGRLLWVGGVVAIAVAVAGPRPSLGDPPDPYAELRAVTEFDGTFELVETTKHLTGGYLVEGRVMDSVTFTVHLERVEGDDSMARYTGTARGTAQHHFLWHTNDTCTEHKVQDDGSSAVEAVDGRGGWDESGDTEAVELRVLYEDNTYDWNFSFGPDLEVHHTEQNKRVGPIGCSPGFPDEQSTDMGEPLRPSGSAALPQGTTELSGSITEPDEGSDDIETIRVTRWSFTPQVEELELIVEHTDAYDAWIPGPKAPLPITARLQKRGGGAPARKARIIRFELLDTSHEPGEAINWPLRVPNRDELDLQFRLEDNLDKQLVLADPWQTATTAEGTPRTEATVVVRSSDWGGSAELRVTAELEGGGSVVGKLQGSGATTILLPRRSAASYIADAWKEAHGAVGLADDDDAESIPRGDPARGGHDGDGLTLYEEYRGFYVKTEHGDEHQHRGWPLLITASVIHHGDAVTVPAVGGSWTAAARVELTSGDTVVPLAAKVATPEPGPLVVDDHTVGLVTLTVAVADADRLAAGDYEVRVVVDGHAGMPAALRVSGTATPPAAESQRQQLLASASMLAGDRAAAAAALDLALAASPGDPNALIFAAGLVGAEDPAAGVALYDRAMRALGAHPPAAILERRAELWQQLLTH